MSSFHFSEIDFSLSGAFMIRFDNRMTGRLFCHSTPIHDFHRRTLVEKEKIDF